MDLVHEYEKEMQKEKTMEGPEEEEATETEKPKR